MSRKHVLLLLAIGALVALLLYKGPDKVAATVEEWVMRALGKSEAARRAQLLPSAQLALDGLRLQLEEAHGIQTFVGSTLRTTNEQSVLVKGGASDTEASWHLLGRAVDLYVIDPATGQPDMKARTAQPSQGDLYLKLHQVAAEWGWHGIAYDLATGKKKYLKSGAWDGGHLEYREGMTFAQAAAVGRSIG